MKNFYTLKDLIKLNQGNKNNANQIITIYQDRGLIRVLNNKEDGWYTNKLTEKELRLETNLGYYVRKFRDWIKIISIV